MEAELLALQAEVLSTPNPFLHDPCGWAAQRAGVDLWSKEIEIAEAVRDNPNTAVHSCHDTGKSFSASAVACWWIDAHPVGEAFVVTTAPRQDQVRAILWREMGRLHRRAGLVGKMNLAEWYIDGEMVAIGRKPADYDPSAFQGIRSRYTLVVLDEACGIPKGIWDAASTLASGEHGRILAIGNPDDPTSEFARVCGEMSGWKVVHIGYKDTPNFSGEVVSQALAESLISARWVEERKVAWGESSPLYISKVMGMFPPSGSEGAIPLGWVQRCRERELPEGPHAPVEAGLDVGMGGDRTVLRERRGPRAGREAIWISDDPMMQVGLISDKLREWNIQRLKIDTDWSKAMAGRLKELSSKNNPAGALRGETTHDAEIVEINFGGDALNSSQYLNARSELYWETGRELSRLGGWDLTKTSIDDPSTGAGPVDDDLVAELVATKRIPAGSRGLIQLEAKKEMIKRLGRSPDRAEALLLAFYPGRPASQMSSVKELIEARWD